MVKIKTKYDSEVMDITIHDALRLAIEINDETGDAVDVQDQFENCFSDDIAYFYLDVEQETKERIIKMKEGGEDERELLEVLVRR